MAGYNKWKDNFGRYVKKGERGITIIAPTPFKKKVEEIKTIGDGEYIVSGKANIEKVFDEIGVDEEPEALTVNGWAMAVLGRIPTEGDSFEADGLSAKVLKMNGRRIENLHIIKLQPEEDEEE